MSGSAGPRRPRALRVGLAVGGADRADDWQRLLASAERAEALGLHSIWLPEGHFRRGAMASPLLVLSACAARTQRLRLGTTSLLLPIHHPLRVAQEVAVLDQVSGGRVLLGLGRGFQRPVFEGFGVDARRKRDRFDAALDTILEAWSARPTAHVERPEGGGAPAPLRPAQRPHPPLFVAAFGAKGLAQAARRGLPYLASPLESLAALARNHAHHRAHLPPGLDPETLEVPVMRTLHVAGSDAEAESVRAALAKEGERLARALPPALARAAAEDPEERFVVGSPAAVAEQLARYRERIGMDLLILRSEVPGADASQRAASLERLVKDVLPRLE